MRRTALLFLLILTFALAAVAAKEFIMPRAQDANTYAAHDVHPMEHVGIAAEPYSEARSKDTFNIKFLENGLLPVFFVVTNNGDTPVQLVNMHVELVTRNRTKISPSDADDLARRLSRTKKRGDEPRPYPIPLPRKPKVGVDRATSDEVDSALFKAKAIEPHTTRAGFLFFDVGDERDPLAGAHLYVTRVKDSNGQELMFFDVPLKPAP